MDFKNSIFSLLENYLISFLMPALALTKGTFRRPPHVDIPGRPETY